MPTRPLDIETLTGAARVALGPELPALFTDDDELDHSFVIPPSFAAVEMSKADLVELTGIASERHVLRLHGVDDDPDVRTAGGDDDNTGIRHPVRYINQPSAA